MKRFLVLLFSTLVTTMLPAQNSPYCEYEAGPSFILSRYHDCYQPTVLKMQSSATLVFDISNLVNTQKIKETVSAANLAISGITEQLSGKTEDATFEIKEDPDSVYDRSYKIYSAKFKKFSIKYMTYGLADKLSVVLNDKEYALSCMDGGMDVHIKYLSHQYLPKREGEKLFITVTEDFPLEAADHSMIVLKKGSLFSFDIADPRKK